MSPALLGREYVVTDFYHGPNSGVADAARDFSGIDFAGRSYFFGDKLRAAYVQIELLKVGEQASFVSDAVKGYTFTVKRTK